MFEQTMLVAAGRGGRAWSTMAGVAAQSALLTAAVLVPMVFPDSLPKMRTVMSLLSPSVPLPPRPAAPDHAAARTTAVQETQINTSQLVEPRTMPERPAMIIEEPLTGAGRSGVEGGLEGGSDDGVVGSILNSVLRQTNPMRAVAPPAKPVEAKPPAPPVKERIVVSSGVQEAMIVKRVLPVYPALARQVRVSGRVELHGVIGTDGRIHELQLIGGHPLLVPAALDAVRQWVYRPTLLNGVPVEVEAPIIVNFTLK